MIPLTHPLVQDYLAVAREKNYDPAVPQIMLGDRLTELGGFPFIREPGGLDLATLCYWYATGRDEDEPVLRLALAVIDEWMYGNGERAAKIQSDGTVMAEYFTTRIEKRITNHNDTYLSWNAPVFVASVEFILDGNVRLMATRENPVEYKGYPGQYGGYYCVRQRRPAIEIKRHVLVLYPEIKYSVQAVVDSRAIAMARSPEVVRDLIWQTLKSAGFLEHLPYERVHEPWDRRTVYRQSFTAPQLIAPDSYTSWDGWGRSRLSPLQAFRQLRDDLLEATGEHFDTYS